MPTTIATPPAQHQISTLEALQLLDSFVRASDVGQAYAKDACSVVVADVIERAERCKARNDRPAQENEISMHLSAALDAMKASDPWLAANIEDFEETMRPMLGF